MAANKNVPQVTRPLANLPSLVTVIEQLRQGVESLGGLRGDPLDRAVTLADLVQLGLVDAATIRVKLK